MNKKFQKSITLCYKLSKEANLRYYDQAERFIRKSFIVNFYSKFQKYINNKITQTKIFQAYLLLMKFDENILSIHHNYTNPTGVAYLKNIENNLYLLLDTMDYIHREMNSQYKLEIADYRRDYEDFFNYVVELIHSFNNSTIQEIRDNSSFLLNNALEFLSEQIDSFKFLLPLLVFSFSPFCNKHEKEFSRNLYAYLRKIIGDSNLISLQIQSKSLNIRKNIDKRNSYDGTTRFLCIFTRRNYDIYLARLDFPHKNETQIHINLHELKNGKKLMEACYPLSEDEINKLSLSEADIKTIFLKTKDGYFFRSKKKQIINELSINNSKKDQLRTLLRQQSHFEIIENNQEKSFLKFISFYCKSLSNLHLGHLEINEFDKENDKNVNKLNDLFEHYEEDECFYFVYKLLIGKSVEAMKKETILLQPDFIDEIAKELESKGHTLTRS